VACSRLDFTIHECGNGEPLSGARCLELLACNQDTGILQAASFGSCQSTELADTCAREGRCRCKVASAHEPGMKKRSCPNPCGYYGQLCCAADQYCYTDSNNEAQCGSGHVSTTPPTGCGNWVYFTTVFVETVLETITSVYSSFVPLSTITVTVTITPPTTCATPACMFSLGETPCGSICCAAGQYCAQVGQCVAVQSKSYSSLSTITITVTTPLRPTSEGSITATTIGSVTTTIPFQTPVTS